ncbi:MAG: TonB-dependent receptor, partial [Bacteroidota bacterium]
MKVLYCALLFLIGTSLHAQKTQISGSVKDNTGEPLIGVTVVVKGTTQGTATDIDGNFVLEVEPAATLYFSFIGYESQEIVVGNQTQIDVILKEDISELEEVVVVGYGTINKRELTTAVASVKGSEIAEMPVPSLDQAIQGRMAGVQVTKGTGAPGGGINIRVRGTASINGGQEPLYIVDGIPINNTFTGSVGQGGTQSGEGFAGNEVINGMAGINPDNIESIEVLKDAAAASIYGARAANGVVLVTTKRGVSGALQADLKMYSGVSFQPRRYDVLNAQQYAAAVNEGLTTVSNTQLAITETPFDTDWQDEVFQVAPMSSVNLSFRGGNENTKFFFSPSYFRQEGIIINSLFERYSFRGNLDHNFNDVVQFGTNFEVSNSIGQRLRNSGGPNVQDAFNNNSIFGPSVLSSALVFSPLVPVRDPLTGGFSSDTLNLFANPVALAELNDLRSNGLRIIGNVFAEVEFLKDFKFKINVGGDIRDENELFVSIPPPDAVGGGRVLRRSFRETLWVAEGFLNYNKDLTPDLNLKVLFGASYQQSENDGFSIGVQDLLIDNVRTLSASSEFTTPFSDADNRFTIASAFTRVILGIKDRYFIQLAARRDASSRFGSNKRFGDFPSASLAWNIIDEPWFNVSQIDNLKLKTSYGLTGNDQIGPFRYLGTSSILDFNYIGQNGVVLSNIENPNYSWESTAQFNVGLELGLLQNRLQITTDYFIKTTNDLLLGRPLPLESGSISSPFVNIGSMENRGFEFSVNAVIMDEADFTWDANFNISFIQQEVLELVNDEPVIGGSFGFANIFTEGEELSFQLYQLEKTVDPESGYRRIKDLNDNGIRDDGDLRIVGSPNPDHFGGLTNRLRYKNWDLSVFTQWVYGNDILNTTRGFLQNPGLPSLSQIGPNLSAEALDRWTEGNTDATFPRIDYSNPGFDDTDLRNLGVPTDQNLEDGSYLKLRNISLGYNFSGDMLQRLGLRSLRAYVTANNIAMLTEYSGYDPEVNHTVTNNIGAGYD